MWGADSPTGIHRRHYTFSLVALVFLPVAVVVDDPVDHVSRPVNVRLVSHHRHIVLAVLVALLVSSFLHFFLLVPVLCVPCVLCVVFARFLFVLPNDLARVGLGGKAWLAPVQKTRR